MSSRHGASMSRQGHAFALGTASRAPHAPPSLDGDQVAGVGGPNVQRKRKTCRFFMSGFCASGVGCHFVHPGPSTDPREGPTTKASSGRGSPSTRGVRSSQGNRPDSRAARITFEDVPRAELGYDKQDYPCSNYLRGYCPYGLQCRYYHPPPASSTPKTSPKNAQASPSVSSTTSSPLVWPPPTYKLRGLPRPASSVSSPHTPESPLKRNSQRPTMRGWPARRLTFEPPDSTSLDASATNFVMSSPLTHSRNSSMEVNLSSEALVSPSRDMDRAVGNGRPTPLDFNPAETSSPPPHNTAALRILAKSRLHSPNLRRSSGFELDALLEDLSLGAEVPGLSSLDAEDPFPASPTPRRPMLRDRILQPHIPPLMLDELTSPIAATRAEPQMPQQLQPSPDILHSLSTVPRNIPPTYETYPVHASTNAMPDVDMVLQSLLRAPPHNKPQGQPSETTLAKLSSGLSLESIVNRKQTIRRSGIVLNTSNVHGHRTKRGKYREASLPYPSGKTYVSKHVTHADESYEPDLPRLLGPSPVALMKPGETSPVPQGTRQSSSISERGLPPPLSLGHTSDNDAFFTTIASHDFVTVYQPPAASVWPNDAYYSLQSNVRSSFMEPLPPSFAGIEPPPSTRCPVPSTASYANNSTLRPSLSSVTNIPGHSIPGPAVDQSSMLNPSVRSSRVPDPSPLLNPSSHAHSSTIHPSVDRTASPPATRYLLASPVVLVPMTLEDPFQPTTGRSPRSSRSTSAYSGTTYSASNRALHSPADSLPVTPPWSYTRLPGDLHDRGRQQAADDHTYGHRQAVAAHGGTRGSRRNGSAPPDGGRGRKCDRFKFKKDWHGWNKRKKDTKARERKMRPSPVMRPISRTEQRHSRRVGNRYENAQASGSSQERPKSTPPKFGTVRRIEQVMSPPVRYHTRPAWGEIDDWVVLRRVALKTDDAGLNVLEL
ncbi:hypothetical protein NEOLEDRAFT_944651 [Neolentinus lepideus HHB14362 ss-1]|uniref:C3H1-type domain-containing protein n=1 Tax=Neolentinus lepideus HHB14362 ss-1 TaxID=1314782 RepID=A0A165NDZ2_9AGAM|nr:hypothetical protein NEOLEDRAFT_944651 [Neolentinus lepideus HHB14362 ss-1]